MSSMACCAASAAPPAAACAPLARPALPRPRPALAAAPSLARSAPCLPRLHCHSPRALRPRRTVLLVAASAGLDNAQGDLSQAGKAIVPDSEISITKASAPPTISATARRTIASALGGRALHFSDGGPNAMKASSEHHRNPCLISTVSAFPSLQTSFGTIGLTVGIALLTYGFGAYFTVLPGVDFSAIMLTYGFPLAVIGSALKYAELKPVKCTSYADAVELRSQATPILNQVRSDVTRYRYGDEQHLDEALKRIFRYNQAGGIQRRNAPILQSIREEVHKGKYSLVLVFETKALKLSDFVDRQAKFTSFFGPGVDATCEDAGGNTFEVRLAVV
eukprot:SM000383S14584  [mRNA]  locus=s383:57355:59937:+ [translate_table: standard]